MQARGEGIVLDQFGNPDNPQVPHNRAGGTGPKLLPKDPELED